MDSLAVAQSGKMHLMYTVDGKGNRIYTLKVGPPDPVRLVLDSSHRGLFAISLLTYPSQKSTPEGKVTKSAHPARFSPDDKFSRHRVTIKKRFGILPTQLPSKPL